MSDTIFLRNGDTLTPLRRAPFESEDALQTMLAKYPDLLAGEQMDPQDPRRWLLIAREMGVPDSEGAPDRWSLDHLFVDQDAIPTLVEVKRASDTRIRREVVGQMLDYASNAVTFWPISVIRTIFEESVRSRGEEPERVIRDLILPHAPEDGSTESSIGEKIEGFWKSLETNLQAGRIRMVFVADRIPEELKRIVEFLNKQLHLAEVLAVELPQFIGSELQTLVPRVYGITAEARTRKRTTGGATPVDRWNEEEFFAHLEQSNGAQVAELAGDVLKWSKANALAGRVDWTAFGFVPVFKGGKTGFGPISVDQKGSIRVLLQVLRFYDPFKPEVKRIELIQRLNAIPNVSIPLDATNGKPGIPLSVFKTKADLQRFYNEINWVRREVEQASP